jgi:hypothetical protein
MIRTQQYIHLDIDQLPSIQRCKAERAAAGKQLNLFRGKKEYDAETRRRVGEKIKKLVFTSER